MVFENVRKFIVIRLIFISDALYLPHNLVSEYSTWFVGILCVQAHLYYCAGLKGPYHSPWYLKKSYSIQTFSLFESHFFSSTSINWVQVIRSKNVYKVGKFTLKLLLIIFLENFSFYVCFHFISVLYHKHHQNERNSPIILDFIGRF